MGALALAIIGGGSAAFSAVISAAVTVIVTRRPAQVTAEAAQLTAQAAGVSAEAAWQTAMNEGFAKLSAQYEDRNKELGEQVTRLEGTVNNLVQHVESLETILRANGLPIPLRPVPLSEIVPPKIVPATVRR